MMATCLAKGIMPGLLAAACLSNPAVAADDAALLSNTSHSLFVQPGSATRFAGKSTERVADRPRRANFTQESASPDARRVANWIVDSGDSHAMPFVIVDKVDAKVFVFDANGQLRGAAPALLGLARGDDTVPGIGDRPLASILPEERTTPAGRFVASLDRNVRGKEILWVDYDTAVSLHPVITSNPREQRAQRLATPTPLDNRISYGCINVPAKFFENVIHPAFAGSNGIVYVLPEIKSSRDVFGSYDVDAQARP